MHALNLDAALRDFRLMLAMYMSGLSGRPESFGSSADARLADGDAVPPDLTGTTSTGKAGIDIRRNGAPVVHVS